VAVPVGRQDNYSVRSSSSECGTGVGAKSAIDDWLVVLVYRGDYGGGDV